LTSSKQRFNTSFNRGLTPNYDPAQSPLFSIGVRVSYFFSLEEKKQTLMILENK
jgi:hypothetical protein